MTPSLRAMVEAMADQMPGAMISNGEVLVTGAGWVNLEKVARAGLIAAEPLLLAEFEAEAAEQQRMDDAVAAEWEGVDRDDPN